MTTEQTQTLPSSSSSTPSQLPQVSSSNIDISNFKPQLDFKGMYSQLLTPLGQRAGERYGELQQQTQQFSQEAGPFRSFDVNVLNTALQPGADLTQAKNYANAQYTGPMDISTPEGGFSGYGDFATTAAKIANLYDYYGGKEDWGYQGALGRVADVYPTLTPGERQYEASKVYKNPNYLQGVEQLQGALGGLETGVQNIMSTSQAIGQARKAQEQDIREQTQAWGAGRQSEIDKELTAAIDQARAAQDAYAQAASKFRETGSVEDLAGIPQANLAFNPSEFNTPNRQLLAEGQKKAEQIWNRYENIKDIPALTLSSNEIGSQILAFDPQWEAANRSKYTDAEWNKLYNQAWRRQYELEDAGFAATSWRGGKFHTQANDFPVIPYSGTEAYSTGGGTKYAEVLPLYGPEWTPPDVRGYVSETQATPLDKESISTPEQRRTYNTISEILGTLETNKLSETQPYQVARLGAEIEKYIADEKASFENQKGKLKEQDWQNFIALRDLDHAYEAAKRKGVFGFLGGGVGAALGFPFGPIGMGLGFFGGSKLGQEIG